MLVAFKQEKQHFETIRYLQICNVVGVPLAESGSYMQTLVGMLSLPIQAG
jgi:hypothetical protein